MRANSSLLNAQKEHNEILTNIINSYDSSLVRAYCKVRFNIININILHILSLCLRGSSKIMDIGCGFGLFGCYFASINPNIRYCGYDLNENRIEMANKTATRLNLPNISFHLGDARDLVVNEKFDAVMMIDLLHHLDDSSKTKLLDVCVNSLTDGGRIIIKDVTTHPRFKLFFTWFLDVVMTHGLDMWYWDESKMIGALSQHFSQIETFPITDWMPYPHIVYLSE